MVLYKSVYKYKKLIICQSVCERTCVQNEQHETDEDICVWSNGCWFTSARKTYEEMARQYKRKGLVWNVDCSFKTENCSAIVTAVMDTNRL